MTMQPGGGGTKAAFYNKATIPFLLLGCTLNGLSFIFVAVVFPSFNSIRRLDWQKIIIASPGLIIKNQPLFLTGYSARHLLMSSDRKKQL